MIEYFAEFAGTFLLILLGNGVVANVVLKNTKGAGGGWIVISAGWSMGVFVAVLTTGTFSGAHINPAVTLGVALSGLFEWSKVPGFIIAQMLGAMAGAGTVYAFYKDHFSITEDGDTKMACFCTIPNIRNKWRNFLSETIGTFVLIFAVLFIHLPSLEINGIGHEAKVGLGSLEALPVALLVFAIGLSLGGTTGYAINPDEVLRILFLIIKGNIRVDPERIDETDMKEFINIWEKLKSPLISFFSDFLYKEFKINHEKIINLQRPLIPLVIYFFYMKDIQNYKYKDFTPRTIANMKKYFVISQLNYWDMDSYVDNFNKIIKQIIEDGGSKKSLDFPFERLRSFVKKDFIRGADSDCC